MVRVGRMRIGRVRVGGGAGEERGRLAYLVHPLYGPDHLVPKGREAVRSGRAAGEGRGRRTHLSSSV